jgi:hypothetical protein
MMPSMTPSANPSAFSEEVADRLQHQLSQRFRGLHVDVHNAGLVLKGRVRTYYAKRVAQHLVMQLTELPILANKTEVK